VKNSLMFVWLALAVTVSPVHAARAQAPETLLHQYKCYLCHADRESKTGPAYVDVAIRYKGNPHAVAVITGSIRKGAHGGGPWHMPPHPEVSGADARIMARYILSLQ